MANEKEIKQLQTLVESMKSASDGLVKVYPSASIALKYMGEDIKLMVADLKGRDATNEQRRVGRTSEGIPGVTRPYTSEEMTQAQRKMFGVGH